MVIEGRRTQSPGGYTQLAELHDRFERLRQRHARLGLMLRKRTVEADELTTRSRGKITNADAREQVGYHEVWSAWSQTYYEAAEAAGLLIRARPRSLTDVLMMFDALEWVLITDGVIVDRNAERQVRRFGRALRGVGAGQ